MISDHDALIRNPEAAPAYVAFGWQILEKHEVLVGERKSVVTSSSNRLVPVPPILQMWPGFGITDKENTMNTNIIDWSKNSWNPVSGCTQISTGCKKSFLKKKNI